MIKIEENGTVISSFMKREMARMESETMNRNAPRTSLL